MAIHACVPGRVRWRVPELRRNPELRDALLISFAGMAGVHLASGSIDTGTLLTLFDPLLPECRVAGRIAAITRGEPADGDGDERTDWHAQPGASAVATLGGDASRGLTAAAARSRLAEHGANALPPLRSRSGAATLVGQFHNLPVGLLVAAGAFSLATGGVVEAAAILAVVGFNAVLGTVIEARSERTIRSLGGAGPEPAHVIRDGAALEIAPACVVPGDLVSLLPGTVVPADCRILEAHDLRIAEAMLTGESVPVAKHAHPAACGAALAERGSMAYRGTAVTGGSGVALVVATGARTEIGRIQRLAGNATTPETPMQRQLDQLGRQLVWASLGACGLVMGVGALRGIALLQVLRSGISLAVAAIPEGLPMVATTTLALGVEDMRKRGVLVRRLDAVESLASVGVVCFDKTGTLTMNRMQVAALAAGGRDFTVDADGALLDAAGQPVSESISSATDAGPEADPVGWLLRLCVLCSDVTLADMDDRAVPAGSPTETALVCAAQQAGLDATGLRAAWPRVAVRHRAEGARFMATAHHRPNAESDSDAGDIMLAVKGSPADVLERCVWELHGGGRRALTARRRAAIGDANDAMAAEALRVLGFAFGATLPEASSVAGHGPKGASSGLPSASGASGAGGIEQDALPVASLTWVGLAGLADPVRPRMDALMRTLHGAGIRTVMMTGDQLPTAEAVARKLDLGGGRPPRVFDAAGIESLDAGEFAAAVRDIDVFARVSPAQKLLVVRALQVSGERVAMTGDGINDSPALRAADVGVAMGGAASSEAAREVADVVLQTDNLAALAIAVERGRTTSVNVGKSIRYLLATNFSEILVVVGATVAGFAEPLTAMQLLWINLVGDVLPALGLAFEPPEPDLMLRPSNRDVGIVGRRDLARLGAEGGLMAAGSLAALGWGTLRHGAGPEARTMAFVSLVTAQLLHTLSARSEHHGLLSRGPSALQPNRPLLGLLLASMALQAAGLLVPGVRGVLGVVRLAPLDLAATAAAGLLPYVANEALKAARQPGGSVWQGPAGPGRVDAAVGVAA